MSRGRLLAWSAALLLAMPFGTASAAQEFWPEIDGFFPIDATTRLFLMAASTHAEESDQDGGRWRRSDAQVGAHLDFTLQPLLRPALAARDWEHGRFLWMRVGYRRIGNFGDDGDRYAENRGILELSAQHPLEGGWGLYGRLKWDLREIDGQHSNRYRVRAGVERETRIGSLSATPYADAEFFHDTRFDTWNRQRYQLGVGVPAAGHWTVEPYLAWQHDTRAQPQDLVALGLTLKYSH
jgi:hypothetical protein